MTWQHEKDFDNGVVVKRRPSSNPEMLAVFDGDERVTKPVAALQAENIAWFADGYSKAKEKYAEGEEYE